MANPGNNDKNLRPAFLLRFGPKYTTGGAVAAISDLKQHSGETVGGFMDHVKIAVDMLHYNVTKANRNQLFIVYCCIRASAESGRSRYKLENKFSQGTPGQAPEALHHTCPLYPLQLCQEHMAPQPLVG